MAAKMETQYEDAMMEPGCRTPTLQRIVYSA